MPDSLISWVGLIVVGTAVAGFVVLAVRAAVRDREATVEYEQEGLLRGGAPTSDIAVYPAPVVQIEVPSAESGEYDPSAMYRSHDVHHPMDHSLPGQAWHTWPAASCPCNNGARLNPSPVDALVDATPSYIEPGYEEVDSVVVLNGPNVTHPGST